MQISTKELRHLANDVDDMHHDAMRTFKEETVELHLRAVRERRTFLKRSGAAAVGGTLLATGGGIATFTRLGGLAAAQTYVFAGGDAQHAHAAIHDHDHRRDRGPARRDPPDRRPGCRAGRRVPRRPWLLPRRQPPRRHRRRGALRLEAPPMAEEAHPRGLWSPGTRRVPSDHRPRGLRARASPGTLVGTVSRLGGRGRGEPSGSTPSRKVGAPQDRVLVRARTG